MPRSQLFAQLSDASFLVSCLADAEVQTSTQDQAVWKQKPKLTFLSGALETDLKIVERIPDTAIRFLIAGKAMGAASTTTAELKLEENSSGTRVLWSSEITSLTGLLKMVPKGLIQAAAQKVIEDVWSAVEAKVEPKKA